MQFTSSRNSAPRFRFRGGCIALLLWAGFGSASLPAPVHAATTTTLPRLPAHPKPAPDGQRFLFVVDISSGTRSLDAANRQALFDLIFTGLEGQMRTGDSFGLWLFNDELHAGQFPMQVWVETNALTSASLAAKYLREQKYAGKSRPEAVMPRLLNLVKSVRDVNVILISNGETPLQGTPFDANISGVYERRKADRNKEQKPFVTLLVARGGAIVSGTVVLAGEYFALPERPVSALASAAGTNRVASVTNAVAARHAPPPRVEIGEPQTTVSLNPQPPPPVAPPKAKVMQFVTRSNSAPAPNPIARTAAPVTNTGVAAAAPPTDSAPPARAPTPTAPLPSPFTDAMTVAARGPALSPETVPITAIKPAVAPVTASPSLLTTPGETSGGLLLVIGGSLLAGCLALLFLVLRRGRRESGGSFISQSMGRR
jgi:hypothetical protein